MIPPELFARTTGAKAGQRRRKPPGKPPPESVNVLHLQMIYLTALSYFLGLPMDYEGRKVLVGFFQTCQQQRTD